LNKIPLKFTITAQLVQCIVQFQHHHITSVYCRLRRFPNKQN